MPVDELTNGKDLRLDDILSLAEVAAYLRVPEDAVLKMAIDGTIPAQKIGEEWRFLRKALTDWMRYGRKPYRNERWPYYPEFLLESSFVEELVYLLEHRLLHRLKAESRPRPGTKEAVLKHFGVFKDDDDLEKQLSDLRKRRRETT